ncbi:MAG: SDH family Clp fold serine proteinase [Chloroflexota bacterium]
MDILVVLLQVFFALFALFFLLSALNSALQHRRRQVQRAMTIRRLERNRGSRVITLIHRQERLSILGIPLIQYIDVEDAEEVLRAVRLTPRNTPIDLVIHTPGGLVLSSQQIAFALKDHPAKVTVMVPHYAMSGGTLIALAADEILMDRNAVLGAVDPQIGRVQEPWPAASILAAVSLKGRDSIDDSTLILADIASKAIDQMREFVFFLLKDRMPEQQARSIAETMTRGRWTHDYPLNVPFLKSLGLPVVGEVPPEVYQLMSLYPQPRASRPSVEYIPVPYQRRAGRDERR